MTVKSSLLEMLEKNKGEVLSGERIAENWDVPEQQCGRQ